MTPETARPAAPTSPIEEPLFRKLAPPHADPLPPGTIESAVNAPLALQTEYHFLPSFDKSTRSRKIYQGDDIPWKGVVEQADLNYLISRDEIAYHAWVREMSALFNRGYKVKATKTSGAGVVVDNPKLRVEVEKFLKDIKADPVIRQSWSLKYHFGYVAIAITRKEAITIDDLKNPADETAEILKIAGTPKDQITEIKLGKTFSENTYGEIVSYTVIMPWESGEKPVECHASRFLHWKNHWIDNHPEGISRLHPLYDKYCVKKTLDHAMLEVPRQMARPIPIAYPTGTTSETMPKAKEYEAMKKDWKDIGNTSYIVLPPNWDAKLLETKGALNPKEYADYCLETLAAGSLGSRFALMGAEAGSISTSDANATEFYSAMADIQKNEIAPIYLELIQLGTKTGQITMADGDMVEIEFEPLWEMDAKEEAEVRKLEAQVEFILSQTAKNYTEIGWLPTMAGDAVTWTAPTGGAEVTLGQNASPIPVRDPSGFPTEEWVHKTKLIEVPMFNNIQNHLTAFYEEFIELFDKTWAEEIGSVTDTPTFGVNGIIYGKAGTAEFQTTLENWTPSGYEGYEGDIDEFLIDAWNLEIADTAGKLGTVPQPGAVLDITTVNQIEADGAKMAKDMFGGQHKAVMDEVVKGIQAGKSYATIRAGIADTVFAGTKFLQGDIYRYVHQQMVLARVKTAKANGAELFRYQTVGDDRVRDTHAALHGDVGPESEFLGFTQEHGCRCTLVPVTVYDDIVEEQRRQEEGAV